MIRLDDIWEAFPCGSYAVAGLMRILEIQETREVETAAVVGRDRAVILVNPDFVARHAPTPERQVALILHELLHVLLGHQQKPTTRLENFVFDAVINATICHLIDDPAYGSLFTSFYSSRRFPECLLRPPDGFWSRPRRRRMPPILNRPEMSLARQVLTALYEEHGTSYSEILELFEDQTADQLAVFVKMACEIQGAVCGDPQGEEAPEGEETGCSGEADAGDGEESNRGPDPWAWLNQVRLLGSHPAAALQDEPGESGLYTECAAFLKDLAAISKDRKQKWSWGLDPEEIEVTIPSSVDQRNTAMIARLISNIAIDGHTALPTTSVQPLRLLSAVPALDRRSNVLRTLGLPSLLHNLELQILQKDRITPVHVYMDVSGSVSPFIGSLCRALIQCRGFVAEKVHLFSTTVSDRLVHRLAVDRIPTTGGTDIDCVVKHMQQHQIRRALIVTDGYVGDPDPKFLEFLKGCHIAVALTPGGTLSKLRPFIRYHAKLILI